MVQSAVDANFNTLRVDGIDMYFPDAFYALCDSAGLLIYHDMQYSQVRKRLWCSTWVSLTHPSTLSCLSECRHSPHHRQR